MTNEKLPGKSVDLAKSKKIFTETQETSWWERVGKTAEAFNRMHLAYANDYQLDPEEIAAAVYLENLNMREFYPTNLGGLKSYDELCVATWKWFEEQKKKSD
jgi:hypothetical protein